MADEAKAAVACMAAWLRFVIDDLFENCLTHDALILHSPARSLDTVTCRGNRRHKEAEQKHEDDDRLKKGFRVVLLVIGMMPCRDCLAGVGFQLSLLQMRLRPRTR